MLANEKAVSVCRIAGLGIRFIPAIADVYSQLEHLSAQVASLEKVQEQNCKRIADLEAAALKHELDSGTFSERPENELPVPHDRYKKLAL
ncbi:MAG: hypothetical protein WBP69_18415 [Terriglobales bacterium]